MKYYHINGVKRDKGEYCNIRKVPEEVNSISYRMSRGKTILDRYPENATIPMSERHPNSLVVSDFLSNTKSILPVSQKMKKIIEKFCFDQEIEYLPFTLLNHKGRVAATDYYIINIIGAFDCLDLEASDIEWDDEDPTDIVGIDQFVLSSEKLKEAPHLFRIKEDPCEYVFSEELVNAFKAAKLTNINLDELEVK